MTCLLPPHLSPSGTGYTLPSPFLADDSMAATPDGPSVHRGWILILPPAVLLMGLMLLPAGCQRVPQVTSDAEVFKELDALYTAITAKNPELLNACSLRLNQLQADKRMSPTASRQIGDIIATAERGEWRPSAEALYQFMRAQRKRPD